MNNVRRLLPAAALLAAACATSTPAPPQAPGLGPRASDAARLRIDLQKTYDEIVALEKKPLATVPIVDVEAAASIPVPQHRSIDAALNLFTGEMHDDIQTSLIRSGRYKKTIDAALAEYKLPKGLAYLPVIESAYLPHLTSRAGAHGIWQFMPDTAKEYGLRVDWWVDERADPQLSARAAASYLTDLYRDFNDWSLALAAYNAGGNRIHRAMQATGAKTFWELLEDAAIPKETRGYVPTFFATLIIASDPENYGFRLGTPDDGDEKEVTVEGPLSLTYVAEITGVDRELLKEMNPALRWGLVPPGRSVLRVPQKVAEVVAARAATMKKDDANIAVCSFTLRENDSVRKLAEALGTKPQTILAMNFLRSAKSIGEGDSIYLPVRARELGTLLAHYNDAKVYYKARKGDTLYSVARKHGLTVEELRDLNDLGRSAKLHPGERLRVYKPRVVLAGGM
jgi:peptidoglycan lytic transglycosylase D